jgi:glutamine---fructose-6-phosphate transaminase (isomerizing)
MCGIVGYTGKRQAQSILLKSLAKLEYRGYDSCGIALMDSQIKVFKDAIRVSALASQAPKISGTTGIGHTRWATHGAPCRANAHPHSDCTGRIVVVHNGVINNYQQLTRQLMQEGHAFSSETDTEVIAHLVEKYFNGNLEKAVQKAILEIKGSYALIVMAEGQPGLVVARQESPLIIGIGDHEFFVASDVPALLDHTNHVVYLQDGDMVVVTPDSIKLTRGGQEVKPEVDEINWKPEQAQKGGYEHFMLKEIHEQPRILRDTIAEYIATGQYSVDLSRLNGKMQAPLLVACGTSYHAALIGKMIGETLLGIPVRVEAASELNYYESAPFAPVTIGISQSGETADTIKAMRRLKESQSKIIAITNVRGSTSSKIADFTFYLRCGPEISVAATKSFTSQLISLYWLFLTSARLEGSKYQSLNEQFRQLPDKLQQILNQEEGIAAEAARLANYDHVFYIGKGINYPIALEGALKLKEISYIHCEAFAAGELKHGPFALLTEKTPVVAIISTGKSREAMLTSIKEIKARGSPVLAVTPEGDPDIEELVDHVIFVPPVADLFSPVLNAVVVQLLAYFAAKKRNCPIDFPRNLAKSVTVE